MATKHLKIDMKKNEDYIVMNEKIVDMHRLRCVCNCSDVVKNLRGGFIVVTIIEFECGERVKVNCHCLEKL
jgi:hypothetical protein